ADDGWRQRFAFKFRELWFVIEQVELARSAGHEEMNDAFGFPGKMRFFWLEPFGSRDSRGARLPGQSIGEQRGRRDFAEAKTAFAQEPTAGIYARRARSIEIIVAIHNQDFMMVSSKFKRTRARAAQAACSLEESDFSAPI